MQAIVLAGGLGTRLREETEFRPKPMVEIGGRPILWHLLRGLAHHGLDEFVIAVGYKGEVIRDYFLHLHARTADYTVELGAGPPTFHDEFPEQGWKVTVADTGSATQTGGRVKRVERYLTGDRVLVAYGDGLADLDVGALLRFHEAHGRLATMTTVRPPSRFGIAELDDDGRVLRFREKPIVEDWVNVGWFVFERGVLDRLDEDCVLEDEPLHGLAADGELMAFRHEGFWQPMDTAREHALLNRAWDDGSAPWRVWA